MTRLSLSAPAPQETLTLSFVSRRRSENAFDLFLIADISCEPELRRSTSLRYRLPSSLLLNRDTCRRGSLARARRPGLAFARQAASLIVNRIWAKSCGPTSELLSRSPHERKLGVCPQSQSCPNRPHILAELHRLAQGDRLDRLKMCASDACRWIFYDRSKPGNRRWCSSVLCGNREETRSYRGSGRLRTIRAFSGLVES